MRRLLIAPLLALSCSTFHTVQTEQTTNGVKRTEVTITSFFDAHSDVTKLRTTFTDKSQGIGVGSITENVSSTNLAAILGAIAEGATRGLK